MLAGLASAALVLAVSALYPETSLDLEDLALLARGERPMDARIVLIDLESWPRSRFELAHAVRGAALGGARVIGLDVLLESKRTAAEDDALAAAIASSGKVVLPVAVDPAAPIPRPAALLRSIARGALATGLVNFHLDVDGVVRRVGHTTVFHGVEGATGDADVPAFAVALAANSGLPLPACPDQASGQHSIDWSDVTTGRQKIASLGRLLSDPDYAAGLQAVGFFRDRIVLIGYLGLRAAGDGFLTPLSRDPRERVPGALLHANFVADLLSGRCLTRPRAENAILLALLAALAGSLVARTGWSAASAAVALAFLGALPVLQMVYLLSAGLLLPVVPMAASFALAFGGSTLLGAQAVLRIPLLREVVSLLGVGPAGDIATLNIVSDPAPSGGIVRFSYQLRMSKELAVPPRIFRSTTLPDALPKLRERLEEFLTRQSPAPPEEALEELGRDLATELFSRGLENALARARVRHLHLELCGVDLEIPWELASVEGRPLAGHFSVSRGVLGEEARGGPAIALPVRRPLRALLVGNPSPLPPAWEPLPEAEAETAELASALREDSSLPGLEVELLHGRAATMDAVSRALTSGEIDLFHFSGHAIRECGATGRSGFLFPDGLLTPEALSGLLGPRALPPLIFANGCGTARARDQRVDGPARAAAARLSLPALFMGAGVRLFVGSLWPVETKAASRFALAFYRGLLSGLTAGEALASARPAAANPWMTHLAYIMYGDPQICLRPSDEGRELGGRVPGP